MTENTTQHTGKSLSETVEMENSIFLYLSLPSFPFLSSSEVNKVPVTTPHWLHHVFFGSPMLNLKVKHNRHPEALTKKKLALKADCGACFRNTLLPFSA